VVDLDAALGEELLEVAVGEPVPQVPAHREQDDELAGRQREARAAYESAANMAPSEIERRYLCSKAGCA